MQSHDRPGWRTSMLSRRGFLKGAGLTAAVLAVPSWLRAGRAAESSEPPSPSAPLPGSLPLPTADIDRVLARALGRGGFHADLFLETRATTRIVVIGGQIDALEYGILQGGGVRTLMGERTGYAFAETFAPEGLLEAADTAAWIAAGDAPMVPVAVQRRTDFPRVIDERRSIAETTVADKIRILERIEAAARAVSPQLAQVTIDYSDEVQDFAIASSTGELYEDRLPVIYLRVDVVAARDGTTAEGMYRHSARMGMEQLDGDLPERAGRAAAEQAVRMLDARPAPTGELPVVVAAGGGVMFHEAVGHGLEADAVLREASVFTGRVGERVATELVDLYDDATVPAARGSFNIDDEGTPAHKTLLIEKGVLRGYMQDRRSAHLMRAPATGNGRRQSFRHPPLVRMTNTYLAPGAEAPEEIIRATRNGIYAVSFGGGEVDTVSGQFTFGLREAYLIENGRVTAPIRGANLVGSGPEVLQRIDRVGSDFDTWPGTCGKGQWVPVTSGCPTLRIARITVGGTA